MVIIDLVILLASRGFTGIILGLCNCNWN